MIATHRDKSALQHAYLQLIAGSKKGGFSKISARAPVQKSPLIILLIQRLGFLLVMLWSRQGCDMLATGRDKSALQLAYL